MSVENDLRWRIPRSRSRVERAESSRDGRVVGSTSSFRTIMEQVNGARLVNTPIWVQGI